MKAYQNKKTGVILRKETYNSLSYSEQLDYVSINLSEDRKNDLLDVAVSAAIGYSTNSALLGGFLGGSFEGGILGDILNGGDLFD